MKTSITAAGLSGDLPAKLAAAGTAGFDVVEIFRTTGGEHLVGRAELDLTGMVAGKGAARERPVPPPQL